MCVVCKVNVCIVCNCLACKCVLIMYFNKGTVLNGYVDISSFPRGSQCILGSLGGKQSFFRSQAVINIHIF